MFTEEDYEREIQRIEKNRRQTKPVAIFFTMLMIVLFVVGGVLVPRNETYGMCIIALGFITLILLLILLVIAKLEDRQYRRMQDRNRYIFDVNTKEEVPSDSHSKKAKSKPIEIDEIIEYDLIDEE